MDQTKQPACGRGSPPPGSREASSGDGFVPLKLLIQPEGPVLELTRPDMVLGRHSDADVRLPLPDVSRRHCRLVFRDHAWELFDLDSLNGVFVNGTRVRHAVLKDHDHVSIGGFRLEVDLSAQDSGGSAAPNAEVIHRMADARPPHSPEKEERRKAS